MTTTTGRNILLTAALALALALGARSQVSPAVKGFQSGDGATVIATYRVASADSLGLPAGTASYMGASVDGSLLGFIGADGFIRWYRAR